MKETAATTSVVVDGVVSYGTEPHSNQMFVILEQHPCAHAIHRALTIEIRAQKIAGLFVLVLQYKRLFIFLRITGCQPLEKLLRCCHCPSFSDLHFLGTII